MNASEELAKAEYMKASVVHRTELALFWITQAHKMASQCTDLVLEHEANSRQQLTLSLEAQQLELPL